MNVFISADIEGVCGVVAARHWDPTGIDYRQACEWMAQEVNAAIEGALEAGARQIVVKDSHNSGINIALDRLHPWAELISGWGPLGSMVEGVDDAFDAVFLVGYHARAATVDGTLAHTWASNLLDLQLNGKTIGETGWAAAFAGHYDVPVVLVTGDDKLKAQVAEELPPGVRSVVTKTGWAYNAARMRPIQVVRDEIRAAAADALRYRAELKPLKPALPATLTMKFRHWEGLNICASVPGVERLSADTFQARPANIIEAQKYFATLMRLARPTN